MEEFYSYFFDYGAMGLFAAWLAYNNFQQKKAEDSRVTKFQDQLDKIRLESKEEVEKIRARYDGVLDEYREERTMVRERLGANIKEVSRQVEGMESTMRGIETVSSEIRTIMREYQEHRKLEAMIKAKGDS
tara:strand:- start:6031 stop:6423 length:393 start_codon:yes stop_codon:yes gene_type:complete